MKQLRFALLIPALCLIASTVWGQAHSVAKLPFKETLEQYGNYQKNVGVTTPVGTWMLSEAIIGNTPLDKKNGINTFRIKKGGRVETAFVIQAQTTTTLITINHARYGNDSAGKWCMYTTMDNGVSWKRVGDTVTTQSPHLEMVTFITHEIGSIRFKIVQVGGGSINLDDFSVQAVGTKGINTFGTTPCDCSASSSATDTIPTRDDNMSLGNPSSASTNKADSNNYLMNKTQFVLSYNNKLGVANWVSWHLSSAWKGNAKRCDCFVSDTSLPTGYTRVTTSNYTNTGFDRGHLCPSDDRDMSDADNRATFLMTNITPQAPLLNQRPWADLEDYCRKLVTQGNELYIIAGGYGEGGTGSNGGDSLTINRGKIGVYARFWKVIVVLPVGVNDTARITNSTRVIAVDMLNNQSVSNQAWGTFRVSVDAIEAATGYDLLSNVPMAIQSVIEAAVDTGATN